MTMCFDKTRPQSILKKRNTRAKNEQRKLLCRESAEMSKEQLLVRDIKERGRFDQERELRIQNFAQIKSRINEPSAGAHNDDAHEAAAEYAHLRGARSCFGHPSMHTTCMVG